MFRGVLMHLLNNASIVLLASAPSLGGLVTDPDAPPPLWLVATGIVSLAAGAELLGDDPAPRAAEGLQPPREQP